MRWVALVDPSGHSDPREHAPLQFGVVSPVWAP